MSETRQAVDALMAKLDSLFHTQDFLHREEGYPNVAEILASINQGVHRIADALEREWPPPALPKVGPPVLIEGVELLERGKK